VINQAGKPASVQIAEQVDAHLKVFKRKTEKKKVQKVFKKQQVIKKGQEVASTQQRQNVDLDAFSTRGRGRGRGRSHGNFQSRESYSQSFNQPPGQSSTDPFSIHRAPMFIFENQVIPIKIHNMSKTFMPNLITNRVLSLGTKFAPTKVTPQWVDIFENFKDFKRKLKNKMFFHLKSGTQFKAKKFLYFIKSTWETDENLPIIDNFCWNVRDKIAEMVDTKSEAKTATNLSNAEKSVLKKLISTKNQNFIINDTDKNVGPSISDKEVVISECKRQLSDSMVYKKLNPKEIENLISEAKKQLSFTIQKHMNKRNCSQKEADYLKSKFLNFSIPHFYIIWKMHKNPIVGRPIVAGYNWILTPVSIFVGHHLKKYCHHFDSILTDSLSLLKTLETTQFDMESQLFTVDFKSLFTNIPCDHAVELMKEVAFMYQQECQNIHFIIELLEITLKFNAMEFMEEIFIQFFGIAMGTNIAPILANLYLAMLEKKLKEQTKNDSKMIWPTLWRRFIDDGFGVTKGLRKDVEYFVHKFNSMVLSIKIDKIEFGDKVNFLDLCIYKGKRFFQNGKFDIKLYQKVENIYAYIPYRSVHQHHTIVNFVIEELHRYVKCNSDKLYFLQNKLSFYKRLRNRGYNKAFLNKHFRKVAYESRIELLKLHSSDTLCSQQEEVFQVGEGGLEEEVGMKAPQDITLKIGGQYISHKETIDIIIRDQIKQFCLLYPAFNDFCHVNKISIIFTKCPNLGNLVVKTKL
jgi:hypothetical protein